MCFKINSVFKNTFFNPQLCNIRGDILMHLFILRDTEFISAHEGGGHLFPAENKNHTKLIKNKF